MLANRKKYHGNKDKVQKLKKKKIISLVNKWTGTTSILHTSRIILPFIDLK